MPGELQIADMHGVLAARALPTITVWNRVEPRPRSVDFTRALRAEVRDALWMLTRQWQLGEFVGQDAGSPVLARYHLATTKLTRFQPGDGPAADLDAGTPIEAPVEARAVPFRIEGDAVGLDLRLALGRYWMKLVDPGLRAAFVAHYRFELPDASDPDDTEHVAHPEVWATLHAAAGRAMDGWRLYEHLAASGTNRAWDGMPVGAVPAAAHSALETAGMKFVAWFDALVLPPGPDPCWDPARLDHHFAVAAPTGTTDEKVLAARSFPGGLLDWPAFSVVPPVAGVAGLGAGGDATVQGAATRTVLPAPLAYHGMPDPRWWAFEDGRTNFGDVRADTTDLGRLLFLEFALVYSNDWYILPCDLDVGSVANVEGLVVTNTFGERLWIDPAGAGLDDTWQRWSMFTLDVEHVDGVEDQVADTSLLLLPTVPHTMVGPAREDAPFLRDEVANMVWSVERTVTSATGAPRRGAEVAAEALAHRQRLLDEAIAAGTVIPPVADTPVAAVRYDVMSSVPEHWIPFLPMHVPGQNRQIQLQRGAMPRVLDGQPGGAAAGVPVRPRTTLLRVGRGDATASPETPALEPYFVHEEEVPRGGTAVQVAFRRTRGRDGRVIVWLGAHRRTGSGEGSSGLAFDQLIG